MKNNWWKIIGPIGGLLFFFGLFGTDKIWKEPQESDQMTAIFIVAAIVCFAIGGFMRTRDKD